jgi:hypothetical protein
MHNALKIIPLASAAALFGVACFDSPNSASGSKASGGARISLSASVNGAKKALGRVGASGETGLESFQVAVADIELAQGLTTSGSGWSGMTGPLRLFSQDMGDHNVIDTTMARSEPFQHYYVDFCSPASLGRLSSSTPFTVRDTGSYSWVVINWAPIFKVRATIPLGGGDTVHTHDGYVDEREYPNSSGDAKYYVTQSAASLLTGPSEDALVRKNNGGTWFRFLRPLRLTEADLDTTALVPDTVGHDSLGNPIVNQIPSGRWNVMLVFNPKDLALAWRGDNGNLSIGSDMESADSAYLRVPFLKATAIPYRDGEAVMRETYEFPVHIDFAWARGDYGMRLELYLIGDNVVAATVLAYPTDGNLAPPEVPVIFFADENPSGGLDLEDYQHHPIFQGFLRKTAVGQTGTVHWDPDAMNGQSAQDLGYTLTEIRQVN